MSKTSLKNGAPRIYMTNRGRLYVKVDELLRSQTAQKQIKKMAQLADKTEVGFSDGSSKTATRNNEDSSP